MTKRHESTDPCERRNDWPRARELVPPNRFGVPMSTLVAGAYVAVTQQVQLQPTSPLADDAGSGLSADGDGD